MSNNLMDYAYQELEINSRNTGPYGIAVSNSGEVWFTCFW